MRMLWVAVAVVALGASSAQAVPITYAFSTVTNATGLDVRNPGFAGRNMRARPGDDQSGPDGTFSFDPATQIFSFSFQTSLLLNPAPVVDLSESLALPGLAGEPDVLDIDFGTPALATPYSTDNGFLHILSFGPLELLLAGSGLTTQGTFRSGLVDANLTDAVFQLR